VLILATAYAFDAWPAIGLLTDRLHRQRDLFFMPLAGSWAEKMLCVSPEKG
jgi:hypothetical protein